MVSKCVAELQAGGWWWGAWLLILHDFEPRRVDVSECVAYSAHESDVIRSRRAPGMYGPIIGTECNGF